MPEIKIVKTVYTKICGFKPILVNIKRLLKHHGNLLDSDRFQTYFSQYQTDLDKVRCFISFKSNIHNMNGILLALAFTA